MSLFFTLGSTVHDWGWPKNGPFWTKNGQTWQACQRSKVVQRGPKGTKMVNLSLFEHLGPFWAHLDPFGPFQTRIDILLRSTSAKPYYVHLGQKYHFCLSAITLYVQCTLCTTPSVHLLSITWFRNTLKCTLPKIMINHWKTTFLQLDKDFVQGVEGV